MVKTVSELLFYAQIWVIGQYLQARSSIKEKLTAESPLFISLSNRRYGQRLSRRGIGFIADRYLSKCGLKHTDLERNLSPHSLRHIAGTLSLQQRGWIC